MPLRLPPVLSPVDLPEAELSAARLDGELFRVGDCFSPIDEIENPVHRARALSAGLSDRLIAEQTSAAWIWGAQSTPPQQHQLCVAIDARVGRFGGGRLAVREVVIEPSEVVSLDGMLVTVPLRTAVDLARFGTTFDASVVNSLMRIGGFTVADCLADLDRRRNLPNKRRAQQRLVAARGGRLVAPRG